MKPFALLVAASLSILGPATASAQRVVLVVDAGGATLDVEALRARISADLGRPIVRLGEEAGPTLEVLTIASAGPGRWVLWHRRGGQDAWVERTGVRADATTEVLAQAAFGLLGDDAASDRDDETFGTRAGHDLVDPFDGRWDPLRVALDGELVRPFIARGGMVYHGVSDPFGEGTPAIHLLDPWAR